MFRLAIALHKSLAEIEEMSSTELSWWLAWSRGNSLPDSYWQFAMLAKTIVDVNRSKDSPTCKIEDFMPSTNSREKTDEQMINDMKLRKLMAECQAKSGRPGIDNINRSTL